MTRFPLFLLTLLAAGLAAAASAQGGAQDGGLGERTGPRGKPAQIGNPSLPDSGGIVTQREGQVSGQFIGAPGDGQGIRRSQPDAGHDRVDGATRFGDTPGLNGGDMMQGVRPARQGAGQYIGGSDDGSSIRRRQPNGQAQLGTGADSGNGPSHRQPRRRPARRPRGR